VVATHANDVKHLLSRYPCSSDHPSWIPFAFASRRHTCMEKAPSHPLAALSLAVAGTAWRLHPLFHLDLEGGEVGLLAASSVHAPRGSGGDWVREACGWGLGRWDRESNNRHCCSTPLSPHVVQIALGADPTADQGCVGITGGSKFVLVTLYYNI
jgi:hypothetical protein